MTERDDIDLTAAEFALGTLDADERRSVVERRRADPGLDRAIAAWENRLAPLLDEVAPVEPPSRLFAEIERRVEVSEGLGATAPGPLATATVIALERQVSRWRGLAYGSMALAAMLLVALGVVTGWSRYGVKGTETFVAVFQKDDAQPAFLMSVDLATREVTIRAVTADRKVGKAYQLWIVAEPFGPKPHSLGLLDSDLGPTRKRLSDLEPAVLQKATFGISEEPPGGSPTGQPTGRAIHGTLHQASP